MNTEADHPVQRLISTARAYVQIVKAADLRVCVTAKENEHDLSYATNAPHEGSKPALLFQVKRLQSLMGE